MEYLAEYKLRGDVQWRLLGERERIALLDIAKSDPSVTDVRIVPLALAVAAPALAGSLSSVLTEFDRENFASTQIDPSRAWGVIASARALLSTLPKEG